MQKWKGKAWYHYHVSDVNVYQRRGGASNEIAPLGLFLQHHFMCWYSNVHKVKKLPLFVQNK